MRVWCVALATILAMMGVPAAGSAAQADALATSTDSDALVRAGFAALHGGRLDEAAAHFRRALVVAPTYSDAEYGLALIAERGERWAEARRHAQRARDLDGSRAEFAAVLERLQLLSPELPPAQRPETLQLDFRVSRERGFEVREGEAWRSLFLKGVNLGAALPGKYPSEFPDKPVYQAWIRDMAELGVNNVRVYTIHPPGFYEALAEHNASAKTPIYLIHGVWVEPPPEDDFDDSAWFEPWRAEMHRVVDLLHGRAAIPPKPGHASGLYRADVSRWVIAYILGREWEPFNVVAFNERKPGLADWQGRFVSVQQGHATEVFMAKAMEAMLAYEHDTYHAQRPMAYTNWPTLDPLFHPTEATKAEEAVLRARLGLPVEAGAEVREYDNDALGLDMEKYADGPELRAGMFASYHAYPYYPDFINLDPGYQKGRDHLGPNNYIAYLQDLVRHHRRHAVVISEFGVPSSRLVAHWQPQGMTHGGQNEQQKGEQDVRMFRNIHDAGTAGGVLFAWIDEWFKKNWLVIEFEQPLDRKPYWYNVQDAEENYGLIGAMPGRHGPNILIDGKADDWAAVPVYQQDGDTTLKLLADEGWLHLGVFHPADAPGDFVFGIDTHELALGDRRLPFGLGLGSEAGLEFVVRVQGGTAELQVDNTYDLFTHRYARPYRSRANDDGLFVGPRTESNRERIGRDGTVFPPHRQEIGGLRRGTQDRRDPAFDSLTEWQRGPGMVELRIPWGLLNVSDPSTHQVVHDSEPPGDEVGRLTTDGFRVLLVALDDAGRVRRSLPAAAEQVVPAPPLFTWPAWEQPTFHTYRKPGFALLKQALAELPDTPRLPPIPENTTP